MSNKLFSGQSINDYLAHRLEKLRKELSSFSQQELSKTGKELSLFVGGLAKSAKIEMVTIEQMTAKVEEQEVQGSTISSATIRLSPIDPYKTYVIDKAIYTIPFSGDKALLECRPAIFYADVPFGVVTSSNIQMTYTPYLAKQNPALQIKTNVALKEEMRQSIEGQLSLLERNIERLKPTVEKYNADLPSVIQTMITDRLSEIEKKKQLEDDILPSKRK